MRTYVYGVRAYFSSSGVFHRFHWSRSHLPLLFVGMEQIVLSNHSLADEALNAANTTCDSDPLLMNELGVMAFTHGE